MKVGFEEEIFARFGLGGLDALIKLVDEVGNPWFGVYGHCSWPRGTMRDHEELELIGERLVCLHSSALDFRVDYEKKLQALKRRRLRLLLGVRGRARLGPRAKEPRRATLPDGALLVALAGRAGSIGVAIGVAIMVRSALPRPLGGSRAGLRLG